MFENGHIAAVQINYKKSANFAARVSKFSSSKNHWDLKNEYFASGATYKNVFLCPFRETVKISEALRQAKKQQYQSEMSELGSFNNLAQHEMCLIF